MTSQVMIDCSKMKKRNTGLFSFCKNLVGALSDLEIAKNSLSIFVPEKARNEFPADFPYMKMKAWHSFHLSLPSSVKVWHGTYQLGKYQPAGNQARVLTIHDLNFLYERNQKGLKSGLKLLQQNIDKSDILVAISEYTKNDILKNVDVKGKEIKVVYNGCEIYKGNIQKPINHSSRPFLFSLGTILAKKNFHVLPCLLYKNDYDLIIAGNPSPYIEKIQAEAKRWGVEERVHIVGAVEEAVKHWYFQNCEAFLFPSIAEGFGLPVVEAMYYGKPLFLSSHTCLPEIAGQHAVYFNNEFEPEQMQHEFRNGLEFFKQSGKEKEMKAHALKFSWEQAAREYWKIYESLI